MTTRRVVLALGLAGGAFLPTTLHAGPPTAEHTCAAAAPLPGGAARVRPLTGRLATANETGRARSVSFRRVVAALADTAVIVHLGEGALPFGLAGGVRLGQHGPGYRYVRVIVREGIGDRELVAVVAHELQHVVEIATTPGIRDAASLRRFYERRGYRGCSAIAHRCYETWAAERVGRDVYAEIASGDDARHHALPSPGATSPALARCPRAAHGAVTRPAAIGSDDRPPAGGRAHHDAASTPSTGRRD